jgi:hypothetical protein
MQWLGGKRFLVLAFHGVVYLSIFPAGNSIFLLLGEVRPFCILAQSSPANKARNRPCSISRAERKRYWPKFFATFCKYTAPTFSAPDGERGGRATIPSNPVTLSEAPHGFPPMKHQWRAVEVEP